jgi:hypothetical protein
MPDNPSENVTQSRADLSQFLIHLTRTGSFQIYEPFRRNPGHYLFHGGDTQTAKAALTSILSEGTIRARAPFGHFKFQIPVGYQSRGMMPLEWLQCVCFSETPISELRSFYKATQQDSRINQYQKYGIAFTQAFVRSRGGHPLLYFDSYRDDAVTAINKIGEPVNRAATRPLLPLCEPFGRKRSAEGVLQEGFVDFRWEREWRHIGNFRFDHTETAFGLCPANEINEMERSVSGAFTFIDPDWEPEQIRQHFRQRGQLELAEAF